MINQAIISIGSNINATQNISRAKVLLAHQAVIVAEAQTLITAPIGIVNQDHFYNTAIKITTLLSAEQLNIFLKEVEDKLGRDRSRPKFGPREIDLDILAWNGQIVDDDFYTRPFLQQLYNEIT